MNPKVDSYFGKIKQWHDEQSELRRIILDCQLVEELKWKHPCYTFNGGNVILLGGFKEYCVISFIKGTLLKDENGILTQQGENNQSVRVVKFTSVKEILELEPILKSYIYEAIEVEKAGLKVAYKKVDDFDVPEELQAKFKSDKEYKEAFEALTPGRQKGFLLHFSGAKQSATRVSRIEASIERVFKGKGINDCICGRSKYMPRCDGSHKHI